MRQLINNKYFEKYHISLEKNTYSGNVCLGHICMYIHTNIFFKKKISKQCSDVKRHSSKRICKKL